MRASHASAAAVSGHPLGSQRRSSDFQLTMTALGTMMRCGPQAPLCCMRYASSDMTCNPILSSGSCEQVVVIGRMLQMVAELASGVAWGEAQTLAC